MKVVVDRVKRQFQTVGNADFIEDPVMNLLYAQSRKSAQRAEQRTSETAVKKKESA